MPYRLRGGYDIDYEQKSSVSMRFFWCVHEHLLKYKIII